MFPTTISLPPQLASCKEAIDRRLVSLLRDLNAHASIQPVLEQTTLHGSRMRPLMLLATAEGLGTSWSAALETACAIECVHLANSGYEQLMQGPPVPPSGKHEHLLLACNALIQLAYSLLSSQEHIAPNCRLNMIHRMTHLAGIPNLVHGQLETHQSQECRSPDQLWEIHRKRSGALMRCAMECAAHLAQTTQVACKRLGQVGEELGIAHQLIEDILRAERHPHSSVERQLSAVKILGATLARSQALQLLGRARESIRKELRYPDHLLLLADRLVHRLQPVDR